MGLDQSYYYKDKTAEQWYDSKEELESCVENADSKEEAIHCLDNF